MRARLSLTTLCLLGLPSLALAQGQPATVTSTSGAAKVDLDKIKEQLKSSMKRELREELVQELREDLKAEIKAELAAEGAATGGVQEDDAWAEEEWKWEEPVKPELNFLEFDGYFRFRYDFFNNLDLNTFYALPGVGNEPTRLSGPFAPGYAPPVPICNTDVGTRQVSTPDQPDFVPGDKTRCANRVGEGNSLGGANMRLRLEPVFNVFEDIKIKMQLDILDNLVLGSTPDGFPNNPITPLLAFSQTQIRPSDGVNALTDSIVVKRAWAEVMTPLGQLRVGRMPSDFGMGLLANAGKGLDSDYGDSNDRIMFATKIGDFYIVPAYDWTVSGPTSAIRFDTFGGQPFDRSQRDDVDQYILAVAKRDSAEEMKQKLENDDWILNYGTYHVLRFQALDAATFYQQNDPERNAADDIKLLERDAFAWAYSFWGEFVFRKFKIEAELAGIVGSIGNSALEGPYGTTDKALSINQHGGSVNMEYRLLKDALTIRLLVAWATGDSAPGWGVRPLLDVSNNKSKWDGSQAPEGDTRITNFRFDPDFVVDMIFWRQLVGTVTDALIIRPGVQYNLTEGFGARLDAVYSRAWFAQSTPSASFGENDVTRMLGSPDSNLGLEFDLKLFFNSEDGFHAWAQYGLFIPFGGLDRVTEVDRATFNQLADTNRRTINDVLYGKLNASIAHTIQFLLGVTF